MPVEAIYRRAFRVVSRWLSLKRRMLLRSLLIFRRDIDRKIVAFRRSRQIPAKIPLSFHKFSILSVKNIFTGEAVHRLASDPWLTLPSHYALSLSVACFLAAIRCAAFILVLVCITILPFPCSSVYVQRYTHYFVDLPSLTLKLCMLRSWTPYFILTVVSIKPRSADSHAVLLQWH